MCHRFVSARPHLEYLFASEVSVYEHPVLFLLNVTFKAPPFVLLQRLSFPISNSANSFIFVSSDVLNDDSKFHDLVLGELQSNQK